MSQVHLELSRCETAQAAECFEEHAAKSPKQVRHSGAVQ